MFDPARVAMNAEAVKDVASVIGSDGCVCETKLDGIRLLAWVTADGVRTFTRSGKEQTGKLPAVEAELARNLPADTWLDGEIVALRIRADGSVEHHWGGAQSVMGSNVDRAARGSGALTYSVFDVMSIGGTDARSLPLSSRRNLLEQAFAQGDYEAVVLTPQMEATDENVAAVIALGFEGCMIKRLSSPYLSGKRCSAWLKIKATDTVDAVVMGYQPGEGKYHGQLGALLLGQYDASGVLVQIAKASGMTDAVRAEMSADPERFIGSVVEFAFMGKMPTGGYRHPQFKRLRDPADKPAAECVIA
jgi:ATP-dependent DNA ligase